MIRQLRRRNMSVDNTRAPYGGGGSLSTIKHMRIIINLLISPINTQITLPHSILIQTTGK